MKDFSVVELSVQDKILLFAKVEFLNHGFKDASLRSIASAAGMTTGAIYTYFKDKNALFEAIVDPVCEQVKSTFSDLSASYYNEEKVVSDITFEKTLEDLDFIYGFIYSNFDIFRLLIVGAEGSSRADFIHTIVDYEVEHTIAYLDRMKLSQDSMNKINRRIIHTISESYINALFEPVRHDMSHEEALSNLDFLVVFYTGGWQKVFEKLTEKQIYE